MQHEYLTHLQRITEAALAWVSVGGILETARLEHEVRKYKALKLKPNSRSANLKQDVCS